MTWAHPQSHWFARTFNPLCKHPADKLATVDNDGRWEIRCLKCGQVTASQVKP